MLWLKIVFHQKQCFLEVSFTKEKSSKFTNENALISYDKMPYSTILNMSLFVMSILFIYIYIYIYIYNFDMILMEFMVLKHPKVKALSTNSLKEKIKK